MGGDVGDNGITENTGIAYCLWGGANVTGEARGRPRRLDPVVGPSYPSDQMCPPLNHWSRGPGTMTRSFTLKLFHFNKSSVFEGRSTMAA